MLDKGRARTWVKVVAWLLAISFGASFTVLMALPDPQSGNVVPNTNSSSRGGSDLTPITPAKKGSEADVSDLVGQGDLALKNGDADRAISFFVQALEEGGEDEEITNKLGDAYYLRAENIEESDTTGAIDGYETYLELNPNGDKADKAEKAIKDKS